jgi:hypothetical protein
MQNGKVNFVNTLGAPLDARGRLASGRKTPMGFSLTFLSPPPDGFAAPISRVVIWNLSPPSPRPLPLLLSHPLPLLLLC